LIRRAPLAGGALLFGGLAIAGAPPLAVFLSEFAILKAAVSDGHYLATGLLAFFIVIAFFGVMAQINRMAFGTAEGSLEAAPPALPFSYRLVLLLAAIPVLVFGVYVPPPLHELLRQAAQALAR
jgi:hydrogenase-4 component F